jgi:hypothetical protein
MTHSRVLMCVNIRSLKAHISYLNHRLGSCASKVVTYDLKFRGGGRGKDGRRALISFTETFKQIRTCSKFHSNDGKFPFYTVNDGHSQDHSNDNSRCLKLPLRFSHTVWLKGKISTHEESWNSMRFTNLHIFIHIYTYLFIASHISLSSNKWYNELSNFSQA